MQRPIILDSPTEHRARRIVPTPPALLVGPSRLLRGDGIGDPRLGSPLSITLMWVACQNDRFHGDKRTSTPPPSIYLEGPFQNRISDIVQRSRHDDYGVIRSDNLSCVSLPGFRQAFLSCRLSAQHIPLVCVQQKETGC